MEYFESIVGEEQNNNSPQRPPTHTNKLCYADENWSNDLHNYPHLYIETECIFAATHSRTTTTTVTASPIESTGTNNDVDE